jgi:hypothetical protein
MNIEGWIPREITLGLKLVLFFNKESFLYFKGIYYKVSNLYIIITPVLQPILYLKVLIKPANHLLTAVIDK